MGKSWSTVEYFFKLYEVEEPRTILYIMKVYEGILINFKAEESNKRRKAEERKSSSGGGKSFTHNVTG